MRIIKSHRSRSLTHTRLKDVRERLVGLRADRVLDGAAKALRRRIGQQFGEKKNGFETLYFRRRLLKTTVRSGPESRLFHICSNRMIDCLP